MATTILIPEKDPMGAAISDFFNLHRADRLRVFSSQFEEDEIPVKELFRSMPSMPMLERTALQEDEKVKTKAKKATYIRGQHGSGAAKMKADIRKKRANRHKK